MARLGDVVKISPSTAPLVGEQHWLLNLDMVEQQTGQIIAYNYVAADELDGSIIQFDTDAVLYSKLRPNLNKVVLPERAGFATSEMLPLVPDSSVLKREYLTCYLRSDSFVLWAVSKTSGAKMPRLGSKELLNKEIPLPSIAEQNSIVQQFTKVDNLISLRERQLAKLDELVKSRFVEMFGTIRANHFNYPIKTMAEVSSEIFAGGDKPQNCVAMPDAEHPYPVYANGYENAGLQGYSKSCRVTRDAVTVSARGTIGYCFIRKGNFTPIVRLITVVPDGDIIVEYLKEAIDLMEIKSSGTSQAQLTVPDFKKERLIIPPLELQNRFAAFVAEVDKSKLSVQQSITQLETLKKSLMQKYFG